MKHMGSVLRIYAGAEIHVPDRKYRVTDRKKRGVLVCLPVKTGSWHVPDRKPGLESCGAELATSGNRMTYLFTLKHIGEFYLFSMT
jgi:hypothetical protein